ncbi:MAG: AbrB family transcriptional regulator [Sphaerochaetaceae bacterium]
MNLLPLLILHVVGAAGALLLRKFRLPAGTLIGSLVAVMILNSFQSVPTAYPGDLRVFVQIFSGLVIGTRFTRADIKTLKTMILPIIILVVVLLITNLFFAFLMDHFTSLSFMTSFFACAPGGVSDLALVATDFGAVMEHVALLQLFRLVSVIIIFPPMIRAMLKIDGSTSTPSETKSQERNQTSSPLWFLATVGSALTVGMLFHVLSIPAGPILGSIVGVAILNLVSDKATYPKVMKLLVQIAAGSYIGSRITVETLFEIKVLLLPAVILIIELFFMAFVTAAILHKVCRLDWATSLFSSTPGGIQEMGLISDELGLETPKIVLMHTFRILAVLGVLPLIAGLFGDI